MEGNWWFSFSGSTRKHPERYGINRHQRTPTASGVQSRRCEHARSDSSALFIHATLRDHHPYTLSCAA